MDFRGITIGDPSRSIDYAFWVDSGARGWTITSWISNVSLAVAKDSVFDQAARRRLRTEYRDGQVVPMLPRRIGDGSCSLIQGAPRNALSVRIALDHEKLRPQGLPFITESKIRTRANISFGDVSRIVKDKNSSIHEALKKAASLALILFDRRGSESSRWLEDEVRMSGEKRSEDFLGQCVLREMMVLTNREISRFATTHKIDVPFRRHQGGTADYGASSGHHMGLGLESYVHGTSPAGRYSDLVLQRQLVSHLRGVKPAYSRDEIVEVCSISNEIRSHKPNEKDPSSSEYDDVTFSEALKSCTSLSFDPKVMEEYAKRVKDGIVEEVQMADVLSCTGEIWKVAQALTIDHIVANPGSSQAVAQASGWSGIKFITRRCGDSSGVIHRGYATVSSPQMKTEELSARSIKVLKQKLMVKALCMASGLKEPEMQSPRPEPRLRGDERNPSGELIRYCSRMGILEPRYEEIDFDGKYICRCEVMGISVRSDPLESRSKAKREASKKAILMIKERS